MDTAANYDVNCRGYGNILPVLTNTDKSWDNSDALSVMVLGYVKKDDIK
jgi:hypothetical protein